MTGSEMGKVATVGMDIAKDVFQIHGVDDQGTPILRRKLKRGDLLKFFDSLEATCIGIEAGSNSHHWARSLSMLGHDVKIMPASYVHAYVKSQKNDAADAEAICEAVRRPTMRFVPIKTVDQQAVLVLHQVRSLLIHQRTMLINALRAHLSEFGIVARVGERGVFELLKHVGDKDDGRFPKIVRNSVKILAAQIRALSVRIAACERELKSWHKKNPYSRRLEKIPGIAMLGATALAAKVPNATIFGSGRELAAWIGLVPQQSSSGGVTKLGHITKRGDRYLRRLLFLGARNILFMASSGKCTLPPTIERLRERKPFGVVCVALANKMARTAGAMMIKQEEFSQAAYLGRGHPRRLQSVDEMSKSRNEGDGKKDSVVIRHRVRASG